MRNAFLIVLIAAVCGCRQLPRPPAGWTLISDQKSTLRIAGDPASDTGAQLRYRLANPYGWTLLSRPLPADPAGVALNLQGSGEASFEIKFVEAGGTVHCAKISLDPRFATPQKLVVQRADADATWTIAPPGEDHLEIGFSGTGKGRAAISGFRFVAPDTPSTVAAYRVWLDPDRDLPGIGFRQRRADHLIPADLGVLSWLEAVQDSSPHHDLVPSMEDNEAQTFNNALVAMAFMLEDQRDRAERILDVFANATDPANDDPDLQAFYLKGEARGFFQRVLLRDCSKGKAMHQFNQSDRWMGDNAWLLFAVLMHQRRYQSHRYDDLAERLLTLLKSWYQPLAPGEGGYVRHGWRKGDDHLHEDHGHPEGNIDAYAVFRLTGEAELAAQVRLWLDHQFGQRTDLPLDLYTWRALAYGPEARAALDVAEHDLRYRKTITWHGAQVAGFAASPNTAPDPNLWLEGTAHMACALFATGDTSRATFYANQLDPFLIDRRLAGHRTRAIPYTATRGQGYGWVRLNRGFASTAAWYLFAKHRFNPLRLETAP